MHSVFKSYQYLFNYPNLYLKESIYRYAHDLEPFDKRMNVPLFLSIPILFGFLALILTKHKLLIATLSIVTTPTASALSLIAMFELKNQTILSILFGLACFDKFYLAALLPSVLMLSTSKVKFTFIWLLTWAALFIGSAALLNQDLQSNVIYQFKNTYIAQLDPDYHPNMGIWWYILQQMFDQYRNLYLFVMWSHLFVYQYPILKMCIDEPLFAIWINLIIIHLFSPNPSFFDLSILWFYMYKFEHYHKYLKFSFLSVATPIVLFPFAGITQYHWMKLFVGNANFVYAATLGWILVQGTAINDYLFAYKRKRMEDALIRTTIEDPLELALML